MATTTSTRDSGLLDDLLPRLENATGIRVAVLAVGSGQALRLGRDGDADLLMTHDPVGEKALVEEGAVTDRWPLMYNDFVVVGPTGDPAGVRGITDIGEAFARLAKTEGALYLSRGDDSGTHRKEKRLLEAAGVKGEGAWYRETGQGMGATLSMAGEIGAYTLSDRATWSAHAASAGLPVLVEGDPSLRNPYALLLPDPAKHPRVKAGPARRAAEWINGPEGRRAIAEYRRGGRQLFFLIEGP